MPRHYRDLTAWQLARDLRRMIFAMTSHAPVKSDFRFVADIRGSSRSVAANIAEGHGRFWPKVNRQFVEFAKASLDETENHLFDGEAAGYFSPGDVQAAFLLIKRLTVALSRMMSYLASPEAERNARTIRAGSVRERESRPARKRE